MSFIADLLPTIYKNLSISHLDEIIQFIEMNIKINGTYKFEYEDIKFNIFNKELPIRIDVYNNIFKDPRRMVELTNFNFSCTHCKSPFVSLDWILSHAKEETSC